MDGTVLAGLSQQMATYSSLDVIANNLANMSTAGFKRDVNVFEQYLAAPSQRGGAKNLTLVWNAGTARDLTPGTIETTGASYDLGINGKGYFVVQTADGPRYTRNGHFSLDAQGRLVTAAGDPLQGEGGDIAITSEDGNVHIAGDGVVTGLKGQLGKVQLVQFDDEGAMTKQGANLYDTTQQPQPATGATLVQGAIEGSNVEPVSEMSHMLEVMRAYQTMTSLMQSHEDLKRQAMDKLATQPT